MGGGPADIKKAFRLIYNRLEQNNLLSVFNSIEMPTLPILAEMEQGGILIDTKGLVKLKEKVEQDLEKKTRAIYQAAGREFNINSPKQLAVVLFGDLGISLKKVKKTAGGAISTNHVTLQKIKGEHPIVDLILSYREQFKVLSTYIEPILSLVDKDSLLHTSYLQAGTATGRLSSEQPNLQNIPQESDLAEPLRNCFIPRSRETVFLSFDYSQAELRILASITQDEKMMAAFLKGEDRHMATAATVFHVVPEEVTKHMRRIAKVLNFGIAYGMGSIAVAQATGIPRTEAKQFIDEYFNQFKAIKK